MNVPLDRQTVRMERHIGTDTQQVVVEGSFALPAGVPDIARIVRLKAHPVVTDRNALEDEIVVNGAVDFVLVYARDEEVVRPSRQRPTSPPDDAEGTEIEAEQGYDADDGSDDDPLREVEYREVLYRHRWRRGAVFEAVFDIPGAHQDSVVDVRAESVDIDVHLHTNGRGIDVEAVLAVGARVSGYETENVSVKGKNFPAAVDTDERALSVENVFARGRTNVSVEGTLPLSSESPARTVVDIQALVRLDSPRIATGPGVAAGTQANAGVNGGAKGRIEGSGAVEYKAIVMDENGHLDSFAWVQQTPFTFTLDGVDLRGAAADADTVVTAEAFVRGLDSAPSTDGRGVEVFADIDIVARAAAVKSLALITAMAGNGDKDIRFRTDTFRVEQWVGKQARELTVTGQLDLPQGFPPVDRLLGADARARVEDVLVLGDKVIIEGQFDVSGTYVARTEGGPVHYVYWDQASPLEVEVSVPGAEPGMEADVRVDVVDVDLDLLNREAVEATVRFRAQAKVTHPTERDAVVEAVVVPPPDADPPTLTFVVVQADDTLWKLSHRYHTDIHEIVRANPWLGSADEPLTPGRKLCVPRRKPVTPATI